MSLLEYLRTELGRGVVAAAIAARARVAEEPARAVAIADDPDLDMPVRVAALVAIALAVYDGTARGEQALDLLEDDLLIDEVLLHEASGAITAILDAAGTAASDRLRRYLAVRMQAAGVTGMHIATLLLALGDLDGAVRAAAPAVTASLRGRTPGDTVALAVAAIVVDWATSHEGIGDRLAVALADEPRARLAEAVRQFAPEARRLAAALAS